MLGRIRLFCRACRSEIICHAAKGDTRGIATRPTESKTFGRSPKCFVHSQLSQSSVLALPVRLHSRRTTRRSNRKAPRNRARPRPADPQPQLPKAPLRARSKAPILTSPMAAGCNGCHGGGGGGGMGPPLTNEVWVYGKDDDTLFRLIALGSDGLQKQGYARKGSENVVGPMPAMGGVVKSNDDLWKIIAWIRSVNPSSASAAADTARRDQ